jgi:multisubunit Na+/H+ antiporter MnhG subunit
MSELFADIAIWVLLLAGTGFYGISLTGLHMFPDIRSRLFTAFRAASLGSAAILLAVVTYGCTLFLTDGGDQYRTLLVRTFFLGAVLAAGTWGVYRVICQRLSRQPACRSPAAAGPGNNEGKQG